jgi:hypothetical protein
MKTTKRRRSITAIFADDRAMNAAMMRAFRDAKRRHAQAGVPMVVWRNGKTVLIPPDQLTRHRRNKKAH